MVAPSGSFGSLPPKKQAVGNGANRTSSYRDFSKVLPSAECSIPLSRDSMNTFPAKLHEILSRPEFSAIIVWMPHGRAWRILQQKAFEERVLPLYFRHGKYTSFARQVNGWGFRRIQHGPDYNAYYHELFLRGMPHLCNRMKRLTATVSRDDLAREKDLSPPDFYAISKENPLPVSSLQSSMQLNPSLSEASCIQAMQNNAMIASSLYSQIANGATGDQVEPTMQLLRMANSFASFAASAASLASTQAAPWNTTAGSTTAAIASDPKHLHVAAPQLTLPSVPNPNPRTRGVVELHDNISTASLALAQANDASPATNAPSLRELLRQHMESAMESADAKTNTSSDATPPGMISVQERQPENQTLQNNPPFACPLTLESSLACSPQGLASLLQGAPLAEVPMNQSHNILDKNLNPDASFAQVRASDRGLLQRMALLKSGATPGSSTPPMFTSSFEALLRQTGQIGPTSTSPTLEPKSAPVGHGALPPAGATTGLQHLLDAVDVLKDGTVVSPNLFHFHR